MSHFQFSLFFNPLPPPHLFDLDPSPLEHLDVSRLFSLKKVFQRVNLIGLALGQKPYIMNFIF